jgi:hypothetical protein
MLDRWTIEVVSARETKQTGRVNDFPVGLADDEAANRAMAESEAKGCFVRNREEYFSYSYTWDTPKEMEEWIAEEWEDFIGLDDETKRATRSAWALSDADTQVRVNVKMLITRWRKQE